MNRLLGQQNKINTAAGSPRSPSTESTRSPMSADSPNPSRQMPILTRARTPSVDTNLNHKRSASPHIASQTLSPSVSRKPVTNGNMDQSASSNGSNMYKFDDVSPAPSTRTSTLGMGDLEMDPQVKLEDHDWAELEDQFAKRMEAFRAEEDGIWDEWKSWGELFKAWASTISVHDEERAAKRLRTRIAFTQGSEESLEAKRQHYIKVVQAFESALQLLGSRQSAHNFI